MSQQPRHLCHWPECQTEVPPKLWGCRFHWGQLPKYLRDRIWASYVPSQEVTKTPSQEYLAAAKDAQEWIRRGGKGSGVAQVPDEWKHCLSKVAYATEELAEAAVERSEDRWPEQGFNAYRCEYGNHWHVGRIRSTR